jgi:hypothetical protein
LVSPPGRRTPSATGRFPFRRVPCPRAQRPAPPRQWHPTPSGVISVTICITRLCRSPHSGRQMTGRVTSAPLRRPGTQSDTEIPMYSGFHSPIPSGSSSSLAAPTFGLRAVTVPAAAQQNFPEARAHSARSPKKGCSLRHAQPTTPIGFHRVTRLFRWLHPSAQEPKQGVVNKNMPLDAPQAPVKQMGPATRRRSCLDVTAAHSTARRCNPTDTTSNGMANGLPSRA